MSRYEARGRGVYDRAELIGMMATPDDAALVVEALTAREYVLEGNRIVEGRAAVPLARAMVTCGRVGMHNCGVTGRWQSHDNSDPLPEPPVGSYP